MPTPFNPLFAGRGQTVFETMSALARETGAINLGQGFPDEDGPEDVRERAARALIEGPNQYPPMMGVPELREAVAAANKRFYGLDIDPSQEVMVASGATEVLAASFLGLLRAGDEAILFEPYYDAYLPMIEAAGATAKVVTLRPPEWDIPRDALSEAFSDKTKLIVVNSPLNPIGKVFSEDELGFIAGLVAKHDALAVCDEAYEHIVFSGHEHIPLMAFPGMRERCVRIGSAGKTFSLTGWKVGYASAAPALIDAIGKAHQFLTFTTPPALQLGTAYGLGKPDAYFEGLAEDFAEKRALLAGSLSDIGFAVLPGAGTYFLVADFRPLGFEGEDDAFCRDIAKGARVAAVPVSAFYHPASEAAPRYLARFCFCKRKSVLEEAAARLAAYFG